MQVRIPSRSRFASRRLLASVWAIALCYSTAASALGLGELTLRSSLNQPFRADIALLDTAGLEQDDISASLATAEEFARAGVERSFFLNDLKFSPDFSGGRKVIHVSSSKVVTEPFMSFVIQVGRPNGQLLRAFTVLLDPPGMGPGLADRAPQRMQPVQASAQPPAAAPTKPRATSAAAPAASEPAKQGPARAAAQDAAQLAAAALENQQLQKSFDEVQARLQSLEAQVADKDKQVAQLQARMAETPAAEADSSAAPATTPATAPAAPAATPTPAPASAPPAAVAMPAPAPALVEDGSGWLNILALVAALLLIIALLLLLRRQRQRKSSALQDAFEPVVTQPARAASPVGVPATAQVAATAPTRAEPAPVVRRETPTATDALDGASIYIAYGRFNEALGILRDGLAKQPERTDLRVRMLEVLGQQGNAKGFAEQESLLLAAGFSAATLAEIRSRFPSLEPAPAQAPSTATNGLPPAAAAAATALATPAAVAALVPPAPKAEHEPEPEPELEFELPDLDLAPPETSARAAQLREQDDEFQLNLDDLSMDADWALVSPFGDAPAPKGKPAVIETPPEAEMDLAFTSNLKELPEVFEMPEEQFLSDFADVEDEPFLQQDDAPAGKTQDDIDNDFLDSFIADSDLPELDALTVDFDDLELQHASAQKLDQAQQLLDEGDTSEASALLHELLREGDDSCKQAARQLLNRMDEA